MKICDSRPNIFSNQLTIVRTVFWIFPLFFKACDNANLLPTLIPSFVLGAIQIFVGLVKLIDPFINILLKMFLYFAELGSYSRKKCPSLY